MALSDTLIHTATFTAFLRFEVQKVQDMVASVTLGAIQKCFIVGFILVFVTAVAFYCLAVSRFTRG